MEFKREGDKVIIVLDEEEARLLLQTINAMFIQVAFDTAKFLQEGIREWIRERIRELFGLDIRREKGE